MRTPTRPRRGPCPEPPRPPSEARGPRRQPGHQPRDAPDPRQRSPHRPLRSRDKAPQIAPSTEPSGGELPSAVPYFGMRAKRNSGRGAVVGGGARCVVTARGRDDWPVARLRSSGRDDCQGRGSRATASRVSRRLQRRASVPDAAGAAVGGNLGLWRGSAVSHGTAAWIYGMSDWWPEEIDVIAPVEAGRKIAGIRRRFVPAPIGDEIWRRDGRR